MLIDSGAEVQRRPLVPKVQDSSPVIRGLRLWDFPHKRREYWLSLQEADIELDSQSM